LKKQKVYFQRPDVKTVVVKRKREEERREESGRPRVWV
jgi:hypothetical protein